MKKEIIIIALYANLIIQKVKKNIDIVYYVKYVYQTLIIIVVYLKNVPGFIKYVNNPDAKIKINNPKQMNLNIIFFTTKNSIMTKSKLIMLIHKNADKKFLSKKIK